MLTRHVERATLKLGEGLKEQRYKRIDVQRSFLGCPHCLTKIRI